MADILTGQALDAAEALADVAAGCAVPHERVREWLTKLVNGEKATRPAGEAVASTFGKKERSCRGMNSVNECPPKRKKPLPFAVLLW